MYKFNIYRCKTGERPLVSDSFVGQITCEYETVARLVERLKAQDHECDYYFMRESGFISRLEYCKDEIKRAYEQLPETAETESGAYITAWYNGGHITYNEAVQLHAYNKELAREWAE